MSFPDSDDLPTQTAPMPDWRAGVQLREAFGANVWRSRSGLEQRQRRRERPDYQIDYSVASLPEDQLTGRLAALRAGFRAPWWVPVWPDGITLESDQGAATTATLSESPISAEWDAGMRLFLWEADQPDGQLVELASRSGRNLTFAAGTSPTFSAGAICWPVRIGIREDASEMLSGSDLAEGRERYRFRLSEIVIP